MQPIKIFFLISAEIGCFIGFNRHFHQHLIYVAYTCHTWMEICVSPHKSWTSIWHCLVLSQPIEWQNFSAPWIKDLARTAPPGSRASYLQTQPGSFRVKRGTFSVMVLFSNIFHWLGPQKVYRCRFLVQMTPFGLLAFLGQFFTDDFLMICSPIRPYNHTILSENSKASGVFRPKNGQVTHVQCWPACLR